MAEQIARHLQPVEGDAYLTRLDWKEQRREKTVE